MILYAEGFEAYGNSESVKKGWLKRQRAVREFKYGTGKTMASMLMQQIHTSGGFTYDPIHAQSPHKGFMVSTTMGLCSQVG